VRLKNDIKINIVYGKQTVIKIVNNIGTVGHVLSRMIINRKRIQSIMAKMIQVIIRISKEIKP